MTTDLIQRKNRKRKTQQMTTSQHIVPAEFWEALTDWRPHYWRKLPMEARDAIDACTSAKAREALTHWNGSETTLTRIYERVALYYWEQCLKELRKRRQAIKYNHRVDCGARRKTGERCRAKAEPGKNRCRFHGGKSTGPRSLEGKIKSLSCLPQYRARPDLLTAKRAELIEAGYA